MNIFCYSFQNSDLTKLTEEEQRVVSKFRIEGKLNGLELGLEGTELYHEASLNLARERGDFSSRAKVNSLFMHCCWKWVIFYYI